MSEQVRVLYDSPEAASIQTVTGWVARTGEFWGKDEHMARWCGATHKKCAREGCVEIVPIRGITICSICQKKEIDAKWAARPRKAWDGEGGLFSESRDEFFWSVGEAEDALDEGETLDDLRLVICDPGFLRQLDWEHWNDDLPDDSDEHSLPNEVQEALEKLNKAIREAGPTVWRPGKFALLIPGGEVPGA